MNLAAVRGLSTIQNRRRRTELASELAAQYGYENRQIGPQALAELRKHIPMPAIRQSVERGVNRRLELETDQGSDLVRALEAASLVVPGGAAVKAARVGLGAARGSSSAAKATAAARRVASKGAGLSRAANEAALRRYVSTKAGRAVRVARRRAAREKPPTGRLGRAGRRVGGIDRRLRRRVPPYDLYRKFAGLKRQTVQNLPVNLVKAGSPEVATALTATVAELYLEHPELLWDRRKRKELREQR